MLLGGMYVIGAYVWASEASFKASSQLIFSQVLSLSPNNLMFSMLFKLTLAAQFIQNLIFVFNAHLILNKVVSLVNSFCKSFYLLIKH